jgi:hypothetical protein
MVCTKTMQYGKISFLNNNFYDNLLLEHKRNKIYINENKVGTKTMQ